MACHVRLSRCTRPSGVRRQFIHGAVPDVILGENQAAPNGRLRIGGRGRYQNDCGQKGGIAAYGPLTCRRQIAHSNSLPEASRSLFSKLSAQRKIENTNPNFWILPSFRTLMHR